MNRYVNIVLDRIETIGNRLPDPVSLFLIFSTMVIICSCLGAWLEIEVIHPGNQESIRVINLLSADNIQRLLIEMPKTFAAFPPLGYVLVVMLGIGLAEKTGLLTALLKSVLYVLPDSLLVATVIFVGIMSSLAADAGYVVLIPLAAALFYNAGRHPIAGLAAAFAGVSAGFSANLVLTALDPLLAGITTSAAQIIDPEYEVLITANYYLMLSLVPLFVISGVWVTFKIVEPRLGVYQQKSDIDLPDVTTHYLTADEKRGLWVVGIVFVLLSFLLLFMVVPENAILRDAEQGLRPFYKSLIGLVFLVFLILGLVYGFVTKKIRNDKQAVKMVADSMSDMGMYIVLAFVAAHFIVLFKWSNIGLVIAISGADLLRELDFTGVALIVSFITVSSLINLFVGSASAKWAVMAPVFVPMLMLLGYSPELTQAAYRIGDASTNVLTPLLPYFPLIIIFARRYMPLFGVGNLATVMLPYSVVFGVSSTLLLIIWLVLDLPLGPGVINYIVP